MDLMKTDKHPALVQKVMETFGKVGLHFFLPLIYPSVISSWGILLHAPFISMLFFRLIIWWIMLGGLSVRRELLQSWVWTGLSWSWMSWALSPLPSKFFPRWWRTGRGIWWLWAAWLERLVSKDRPPALTLIRLHCIFLATGAPGSASYSASKHALQVCYQLPVT